MGNETKINLFIARYIQAHENNNYIRKVMIHKMKHITNPRIEN